MPRGFSKNNLIILGIALISLITRSIFAARLRLFQDEALYWWFSQDQGISFCPHPPVVPILIKWGESLLGPGPLGVRAGSLLFGTLGIVMAAVLGRILFGRVTSVWAAGLYAACPLIFGTSSIATPDAPILFLWLLFFGITWRAFQTDHLAWWLACGFVLALGLYTKYMMALALPVALIGLFSLERGRRLLKRPGPWMAVAFGLMLFLMVFVPWETYHGWPTVQYHLMSRHVLDVEISNLGPYLLGHIAGISPILWAGIWVSFWRYRPWLTQSGKEKKMWLLVFGLLPILFFFFPSVLTKRQLIREHWDLIGYCVGIIAFSGMIIKEVGLDRVRWPRWGISAAVVSVFISAILMIACLYPGLAVAIGLRPPTAKMMGWKDLAVRVNQIEQRSWDTPHFILTNYFSAALCLGFERRSRDGIYTITTDHTRRYGLEGQLADWGIDQSHFMSERQGQEAIYIHEFKHPDAPKIRDFPKKVFKYFQGLEPLDELQIKVNNQTVRRFGIYRAYGMKTISKADNL